MFKIHICIEKWKFNKNYQLWVSNLGNFKDKSKETITPKVAKDGYLVIPVCNNKRGEIKYLFAHRVVMETWCPRADMWKEKLTVDHLNHNKRDNTTKNLEWVTQQENLKRAAADIHFDDKDKEIQSLKDKIRNLEDRVEALECSEKAIIIANGIHTFGDWNQVKEFIHKCTPNTAHLSAMYIKGKIDKAMRTNKTYCGYTWKIKYKEEI